MRAYILTLGLVAVALADGLPEMRGNGTAGVENCAEACVFLSASLPGKIHHAETAAYDHGNNHWSAQQASTKPACRASPTSAEDVSDILKIVQHFQCYFAVKSGGHGPHKNSNIDGGVTIDMGELNQVTVSADKTQTRLGSGGRWGDVYQELDKQGLSVVGGRVGDIGVGGLLLGGGLSFYSPRYGFSCDNVLNYEVVFADGSINQVNPKTYPDLHYALRGGGNNFGIVTNFDVFTFPQEEMLGGTGYYAADKIPTLIDSFHDFSKKSPSDPYAAVILALAWVAQWGDVWVASVDIEYTKSEEKPEILSNLLEIEPMQTTLKIQPLTAISLYMNSTTQYGLRQLFYTFTYKSDLQLTRKMYDIFVEEVDAVKASIQTFLPACVFQAFTPSAINTDRNPFGIRPEHGPLTIFLIPITWGLEEDDDMVFQFARNVINRGKEESVKAGKDHPYVYMNYAAEEQDVFGGYGEASGKKLRAVKERYDPEGLWGPDGLLRGGFKF